jgi:plastocyanin
LSKCLNIWIHDLFPFSHISKKMKNIYLPILIAGILSVSFGCKKSTKTSIPVLTTVAVTNITQTSATSGGDISSDGNATVVARGVCYSTSANPSITDPNTSDGTGSGQFVSNISGLTTGTLYYVRAYATNSAGTAYGNQVSFSTGSNQLATLTTTAISAVTATTAVSGGTITDDGGSGITARGVCWGRASSPTIDSTHTSEGTGKGTYVSNLSGLDANTMYYVRAYATNSIGTSYGNELSFTTSSVQSGNDVSISGMAFNPQILTIQVNATVKWTNNDPVSHTVTSDNALFDSGAITPGTSYSHQFTSAGTFTYHCSIHPYMTGSIIVQ